MNLFEQQLQEIWRFDSAQSAMLSRNLEYVRTKVYETKYETLKGRQLMPINADGVPPVGSESFVTKTLDYQGQPARQNGRGTDIPLVSLKESDQANKVFHDAVGYTYTQAQLRAASYAEFALDTRLAAATRKTAEEKIDEYLAVGGGTGYLPGLLNDSNVAITVLPNATAWAGLTADQIAANLLHIETKLIEATREMFPPTDMVLPLRLYNIANSKMIADNDRSTALSLFLKNSRHIKTLTSWYRAENAGAASKDRIVAYRKDPEVLQGLIPMEFLQHPPQVRDLAVVVPCEYTVAGTEILQPLAVTYADVPTS